MNTLLAGSTRQVRVSRFSIYPGGIRFDVNLGIVPGIAYQLTQETWRSRRGSSVEFRGTLLLCHESFAYRYPVFTEEVSR